VTPVPPRESGRDRRPAAPSGPSGYLLAALVMFLVAPVSLLAWPVAVAALRAGARRWVLALCGLVPGWSPSC
jgi:hypothetical protein